MKPIRKFSEKEISRFWGSLPRIKDPRKCWEWGGTKTRVKGGEYGIFVIPRDGVNWKQKEILKAHRVAFFLFYGELDEARTIDHTCENKLCCNPRHMEPVDQSENVLRSYRRHPERLSGETCKEGHSREPGKRCVVCNREAQRKWDAKPKNRKKAIARGKRWYQERGGKERKAEKDMVFTEEWHEMEKGDLC